MATGQLQIAVNEQDHIAGMRDAAVVLVQYGDFECPYCGQAYPIIKAAQAALGARLAFVFRYFPLVDIHPHAAQAAEAAEAAAAQDAFWEMHDMLFEHQRALEDNDLVGYARTLELDVEQFAHDLTEGTHGERISADFAGGVRSGVNGTPTFFINGVRFDGNWADEATLIGALEEAAEASHAGSGAAD
jgi:protein-disulfide isomerase